MPHGFENTAMWNLNGDDIKNAKEQLETRRVKLKADYEEGKGFTVRGVRPPA